MKTFLIAASAATLFAASGVQAQQIYGWTPAGSVTPTPMAMDYLMFAGAGDLYEIQSSQLVLETTADPAIRRFAQMMVEHHTGTTRAAETAARAAGMTPPPPTLDAPKTAMVQALGMYSGVERDRLYLTQQHMAHKEALGLQKTYAETGDTPQLRTAARSAVPIIQRHLAEVERLMAR
jgi:putative membrane protein